MKREQTRKVRIGNRIIGGGNPILIQSMCNTKTESVEDTVAQIHALEQAGCEIIRVAVPTREAAEALSRIKRKFIFHWWRISILITALPLRPWRMERIKSASIRAILVLKNV